MLTYKRAWAAIDKERTGYIDLKDCVKFLRVYMIPFILIIQLPLNVNFSLRITDLHFTTNPDSTLRC